MPFVPSIQHAPREIFAVRSQDEYPGSSLLRAIHTDPPVESDEEKLFRAGKNGGSFFGQKSPERVRAFVKGERAFLGLY